jgi:hypothetical protein
VKSKFILFILVFILFINFVYAIPSTDHIIACYDMVDESEIEDKSGKNIYSSLYRQGSPTFSSTELYYNFSGSVDAATNYLNATLLSGTDAYSSNLTVLVMGKFYSAQYNPYPAIVSMATFGGNDYANGFTMHHYTSGGNHIDIEGVAVNGHTDKTNEISFGNGIDYNEDTMYGLVLENGGKTKLYINDSLGMSETSVSSDTGLSLLTVGARMYGGFYRRGSNSGVQRVVVINTTLTDAEFSEWHNAGDWTTCEALFEDPIPPSIDSIIYTNPTFDKTPSITINLDKVGDVYINTTQNSTWYQCLTTDTQNHTCTIPYSLNYGITYFNINMTDASGNSNVSNSYNITISPPPTNQSIDIYVLEARNIDSNSFLIYGNTNVSINYTIKMSDKTYSQATFTKNISQYVGDLGIDTDYYWNITMYVSDNLSVSFFNGTFKTKTTSLQGGGAAPGVPVTSDLDFVSDNPHQKVVIDFEKEDNEPVVSNKYYPYLFVLMLVVLFSGFLFLLGYLFKKT